ncbi:hypothetical protein CATRI_11830 [Corynebacterium atrinae]|nr:hypothetical protein CATRI_11830 [Corynebacterium atrinae]
MSLVLTSATIILSAVLFYSGIGKLRFSARERARHMHAMAYPETRLTAVLAALHPFGEIGLAAALLFASGSFGIAASVIVIILLAFYLLTILRQYLGRLPGVCPCFGPPRKVTKVTILRNSLFLGLGFMSLMGAMHVGDAPVSVLLSAWPVVLVVALALATLVLIQRAESVEAPPEADYLRLPTPDFPVWQNGRSVGLRQLSFEGPILLVVAEHRSEIGGATLRRIPAWRNKIPTVRVLAAVRRADAEWKDETGSDAWHRGYLFDSQGQVFDGFHIDPAVPTAILLGADGLLAGGPVFGREAINRFVEDIARELNDQPNQPA